MIDIALLMSVISFVFSLRHYYLIIHFIKTGMVLIGTIIQHEHVKERVPYSLLQFQQQQPASDINYEKCIGQNQRSTVRVSLPGNMAEKRRSRHTCSSRCSPSNVLHLFVVLSVQKSPGAEPKKMSGVKKL